MQGALLVDKPAGPTSHDVVAVVRRVLKTSRVGHTGTLDPLATGLLVILVGAATRLAQFLAADEKEYIADVRLGVSTPTYDAASLADAIRYPMPDSRYPMDADIDAALARFRGLFLQMPPPFSAKKIAGVPAYERARKNQPVDLQASPVTVRELERLDISDIGHRSSDIGHRTADIGPRSSDIGHRSSDIGPRSSDIGRRDLLRLRVAASAGFYVRSLAHDLGQALGCGAHLEALRRTRVGRFRIDGAVTLDRLESAPLIAPASLLGEMPSATLSEADVVRAGHGNPVKDASGIPPGFCRLLQPDGTLLAVAARRPDGLLHPVVVLR